MHWECKALLEFHLKKVTRKNRAHLFSWEQSTPWVSEPRDWGSMRRGTEELQASSRPGPEGLAPGPKGF